LTHILKHKMISVKNFLNLEILKKYIKVKNLKKNLILCHQSGFNLKTIKEGNTPLINRCSILTKEMIKFLLHKTLNFRLELRILILKRKKV